MADLFPMRWWRQLWGPSTSDSLQGKKYRVIARLYSADGKRCAEVCKFRWGKTYLLESEWVEGTTYAPRHVGRMVGPFKSPLAAERFITATEWFNGTVQAAS